MKQKWWGRGVDSWRISLCAFELWMQNGNQPRTPINDDAFACTQKSCLFCLKMKPEQDNSHDTTLLCVNYGKQRKGSLFEIWWLVLGRFALFSVSCHTLFDRFFPVNAIAFASVSTMFRCFLPILLFPFHFTPLF